jgi:hypothetical protein
MDRDTEANGGSDFLLFIFVVIFAAILFVSLNMLSGDTDNGITRSTECARYYTVQAGDSFSSIASAAQVKESDLYYANPDGYLLLKEGMQICIPSRYSTQAKAEQVSIFVDEPLPMAGGPVPTPGQSSFTLPPTGKGGGMPILPAAGFGQANNGQLLPPGYGAVESSHKLFFPVTLK